MRFGLLGPLTVVTDAGDEIGIAAPRQRVLLTALLLGANQPLSVDALADAVWDGSPPRGSLPTLRSYVMRLRHVLGPQVGTRLETRSPGYRFRVAGDELDLTRFEALGRRGRAALHTRDWTAASAAATQAVALWRAAPLADVPSQLLRDAWLPRLEELHRQAWEARIAAELELGHHELLIPELRDLTSRYPLRENLQAALVRALARTGQRAQALAAYQTARRMLVDELGIEPGPELRDEQRRILAEEQLDQATVRPATVVPRQLPPGVPGFVGRADELRTLSEQLDAPETVGTVVISAIGGAAGIGKTALAVHWAHTVAARFPDGQLHVDLRGFDPVAGPLGVAEAVRSCLDALDVPVDRMPVGLTAQVGLYRSLLAGRRMLILLDNARDGEQVRPLLPDSPGCLVLVTSRRELISLTATAGARLITVGLLKPDDARQLLAGRLRADRLAGQAEAVEDLIGLCAGLPLALSVAAARCAARPDFPISALVAQVHDARDHLDALSGDGPATDLRTLFWTSYQQLSGAAARLFRLLGHYPGLDFTAPMAASLAALDRRAAVAALAELAGAHLVDERVPGRFGMHDLLRAYAAELSTRDDADADRHAAIDRAFRHYLLSLDAADRVRYPGCPPLRTPAEQPGIDAERFADPGEALQWCQRQRPALAALIGRAAQDGPATYMAEGRWSLWLYFHLWGHWADLGEARRVVLTTTRAIDESRPEPEPVPGDHTFAQARDHYRRLVELGQRRGEDSTAAYCLFGLTQMLARQGRPTEALTFAGHAVDWFSRSGDRAGIALALNQIGHYQVRMGLAAEAERNCRQALALGRELGDQLGAASAETTLGQLAQLRGELAEAGRHYASAATGFRAAGERDGRRQALTQLGDIRRALGDPAGAARSWQAALDLLAGPDHPHAADLRDRLRSLRRRPLPCGST